MKKFYLKEKGEEHYHGILSYGNMLLGINWYKKEPPPSELIFGEYTYSDTEGMRIEYYNPLIKQSEISLFELSVAFQNGELPY